MAVCCLGSVRFSEASKQKKIKKLADGLMEELTSMERVLFTLRGEETDRVPVYTLAIGATRQVTGVSFLDFSMNSKLAADAMIYANRIIGDDILVAFIDLSVEAGDFGQELIYPQNTTAHPNYDKPLIRNIKDYDRLPLVNVLEGIRMGSYGRRQRFD